MNCAQIKDLMSSYQDGELNIALRSQFKSHLDACSACLKEYEELSGAWDMLRKLPEIAPAPDYMSRFWTRAAARETPQERFLAGVRSFLGHRRLVPVLVSLCLMVIIGSSTGLIQQINTKRELSQMKSDDIALMQNMDLAQHYEIIKDLDVIRSLATDSGGAQA